MKIRDSGMPAETMWQSFFDVEAILDRLGIVDLAGDVVDLGCGYGTFAVPAAQRTRGTLHAFDLEPEMVAETRRKGREAGLTNLVVTRRDFLAEGTGLPDASCECVMAFNILHAAAPLQILGEAARVLRPEGRVAVIHWIPDPTTPRGPEMAIRPRAEQVRAWLEAAGFAPPGPAIALPPYHYGVVAVKLPRSGAAETRSGRPRYGGGGAGAPRSGLRCRLAGPPTPVGQVPGRALGRGDAVGTTALRRRRGGRHGRICN